MSQWKIDPAGVQSVLNKVAPDKTSLEGALTEAKFQAIFDGLKWGGVITDAVPTAVSNVLKDQSDNLKTISFRINAGVVGVANATIAYNNGQETMIGNFQTEMLGSAEDGDFSYFEEHGKKS